MGVKMVEKLISNLSLPVDINYLTPVQAFISELGKIVKLNNIEIKLLNLGVEEAISNVVKHAYLPDEKGSFEVTCEITPLEFEVIIKDKGLPFAPEYVKDFIPIKDAAATEKPGLGFRLMKNSVDKLIFENKGWGGKEVHLIKHLKNRHIKEYLNDSKLQAYKEPWQLESMERKKISYHIEFLKPEYAIEISQCAYRTYGYSYMMENIYYPKRLIKMAQEDELISAVAVRDERPIVMGHAALERFGYKKDVPELGMAFTKPEFRGMGCMSQITDQLIQKARFLQLKGIFAKGVTTHPYSQKFLLKAGFENCAILLGLSPPKQFKKMKRSLKQRETLLVCYKKLLYTESKDVYVPPHHQQIINDIYDNLLLHMNLHLPPRSSSKLNLVQTEFTLDINDFHKYANIFVNKISKNFIEEIKSKLRELCQKKIEAINLYLNLCNKSAAIHVKELEDMGFFFAGIFPSLDKQFLILQYLNNVPINYNKIVIADDFTNKLLDYIKNLDPNR